MQLETLLALPPFYFVFAVMAFLVALVVIVFIHELGHFLVARWCGVSVEAFSIGFGREIFGWNDRHGTRWKVGWLPLGGYVKFVGDANAASMPGSEIQNSAPGSFHSTALWKRALVVAAGPMANFLLAMAIFAGAFMFYGVPVALPVIGEVVGGSAAEEAGMKPGDIIVSIDGRHIATFEDLQQAVFMRPGEHLAIVLDRGGTQITVDAVPKMTEQDDGLGGKMKVGLLGIKNSENNPIKIEKLGPFGAVAKAADRVWFQISTTFKYIGKMFAGAESIKGLRGGIGIAQVAGSAASMGLFQYVWIIAFLSVNIGLINLFPIPMLDGGHLVFYGIEAVRGKPLGPTTQEWAFRVGLSLVIMLMMTGAWNDISRLLGG
ncbi:RIP metalloprotease RseP [Aestuariivirga sp.]|uniref:RIP metalloprotease RseP n=1 Tax=Aestuariivirga sp. TaxID=2650926 RepID=UPI0039E32763